MTARPADRAKWLLAGLPQGRRWYALGLAILLFAWFGVRKGPDVDADPAALIAELQRLSTRPAVVGPRLSIDSDASISGNPVDATGRILTISAAVARATANRSDFEALHVAALLDLRWGTGSRQEVDRAIERLQSGRRIGGPRADLLANLSAAYLTKAEAESDGRAILDGIEASAEALEMDPRHRIARFNLVYALQLLGLSREATREGRRYLAEDSVSLWASRVRKTVEDTAAAVAPILNETADSAAAIELVRQDKERARLIGWSRGLEGWGRSVVSGDTAAASALLRFASTIGGALGDEGGDATLAEAVKEVEARATDPRAFVGAAKSVQRYAEAQRLYGAGDYENAVLGFSDVVRDPMGLGPVQAWARVFRASSLVHSGHAAEGEKAFHDVLLQVKDRAYPALVGRAYGGLSTSLLRRGADAEARAALDSAEQSFARASERENVGAIQSMQIENRFFVGDGAAGYATALRALTTLRAYPQSQWRHNALYVLAVQAMADGLGRAALLCQDEGVAAAAGTGRPVELAEALTARVRLRALLGQRDSLQEDIDRAIGLLAKMPIGSRRSFTEADLMLSRGLAALDAHPGDAAMLVDSSLAFFRSRGNVLRELLTLPVLAEVHAGNGDVPAALRDLSEAIAMFDARASRFAHSTERAMFYDQAQRALARIAMLRVANGDVNQALREVDRARWTISGVRDRPRAAATVRDFRLTDPAISYVQVGDTLLTWLVTQRDTAFVRQTINGGEVASLIDRVRAMLELGQPQDEALRKSLEELHEVFIRPIADRLGAAEGPLTIVADAELSAVPFAALYDARRERYLVEDFEVRFATSLQDAGARLRPVAVPEISLIADPAFDVREHEALGRLPHAAEEVAAIARIYPRHRFLSGDEASASSIEDVFASARVVHYAGHAVVDDERPARSYLPAAGAGESSRLMASSISRLQLRNMRLVVLSSCRTVGAQRGAVAGLSGLASAFRAAGAGGVLASTWQVDDLKTQQLMIEFHRNYTLSGDGARSLRQAQLALLRSRDPLFRSPGAWAAFRYIGD